MIKLSALFTAEYGSREYTSKGFLADKKGNIPLIASWWKENGVFWFFDIEPEYKHVISVARTWSVWSAFYQWRECSISDDCIVLTPKEELTELQMIYYASLIDLNKYRYTYWRKVTPGRLLGLEIPDIRSKKFNIKELNLELPSKNSVHSEKEILDIKSRREFRYDEIFDIKKGYYNKKPEHIEKGNVPFIGATEYDNGITDSFTIEEIENTNKAEWSNYDTLEKKIFKKESITVTNNWSVGRAFFQPNDFTCSHDVNPLYLKNHKLNIYISMFLITIIELEQYRWNYWRKRRPARMPDSIIKLPVDKDWNPDRIFMENYIKSLSYSSAL